MEITHVFTERTVLKIHNIQQTKGTELPPSPTTCEFDFSHVLVSIVIPTYNRAWGLKLAIESALAQSHANIEVMIVDDCSQDETAQVAEAAASKDGRVVFFRQPANVGMVSNWGYGLHHAKGEFVIFLADDDQLRPDFIANRLCRMSDNPDLHVAFSKYDIENRDGSHIRTQNAELNSEIALDSEKLLEAALSRQWFVGASLYRKNIVEGVWDEIEDDDLVLDFGLNIRIALKGHGIYIPKSDFIMLSHPGQNSQAKRFKVYQQTSETLERIIAQNLRQHHSFLLKQELAACHIGWGRYMASIGRIGAARSHFAKALLICPTSRIAWLNFGLSSLWPKRLSKRSQRDFTDYQT